MNVNTERPDRKRPPKRDATTDSALLVARELFEASQGRLTAVETIEEGIRVEACMPTSKDSSVPSERLLLSRGTCLMKSAATRIALDPSRWTTHCGFCASKIDSCDICSNCQIIGLCSKCQQHKPMVALHDKECLALKTFKSLFDKASDSESHADADPDVFWQMDPTSHILTIRLLCSIHEDSGGSLQWWQQISCLYLLSITEFERYNAKLFVSAMREQLLSETTTDATAHDAGGSTASISEIWDFDKYQSVLGRVLGCSHAIVDLSLPLGCQSLGRALFWHHSFYNHSCAPNAFLSCDIAPSSALPSSSNNATPGTLSASVHLIRDVSPGEPITLSYIPMSGLSTRERQDLLQTSYEFQCQCQPCRSCSIQLPNDADVDPIREIQFSCNARLLAVQREESRTQVDINSDASGDDEIENVLSLARMTQRGIQNQGIPSDHEVSLEAHRLLALGYSMLGRYEEAIRHHGDFLQQAPMALMDPVAMATQRLALARDMAAAAAGGDESSSSKGNAEAAKLEWQTAMEEFSAVIGKTHPWVQELNRQHETPNTSRSFSPRKRPRLDTQDDEL